MLLIHSKLNSKILHSHARESVTNVYVLRRINQLQEFNFQEIISVKEQLRLMAFRHALLHSFSIVGYLMEFLVRQFTYRTRTDIIPL
jgi:hypothetical protein